MASKSCSSCAIATGSGIVLVHFGPAKIAVPVLILSKLGVLGTARNPANAAIWPGIVAPIRRDGLLIVHCHGSLPVRNTKTAKAIRAESARASNVRLSHTRKPRKKLGHP